MEETVLLTAIDFETTGSVPGWPNEPWQIGLCEVRVSGTGAQLTEWLHVSLQRPFNSYTPGRHAEIREELAEAAKLSEQWDRIGPWVRGRPLVAHNIGTERTILRKSAPLERFGPWVDTLQLAREVMPGMASYSLESLIQAVGIEKIVRAKCPGRGPHDALYDAVACGEFLCYILSLPSWKHVVLEDIVAR